MLYDVNSGWIGRKRMLRYIKACLALEKRRGQEFTAQEVLEEAKSPGSPLHDFFEWKDRVAGEKWRLQQARHLIAAVRVYVVDSEGKKFPMRRFVSVSVDGDDGPVRRYTSVFRVLKDHDFRTQQIEQAVADLENWLKRYHAYSELKSVRKEISVIVSFLRSKYPTAEKKAKKREVAVKT